MIENYLEKIVEDISDSQLGAWQPPRLKEYSHLKTLFPYQEKALINAAKVLSLYYHNDENNMKYYEEFGKYGLDTNLYNVPEYLRPIDVKNGVTNPRYSLLKDYYDTPIQGYNFLNRMAFWMATGSGKSIVLIKMIEYISYLQEKKLIPHKDILLLLPREDLINQFKLELDEFNLYRDKKIELVNLNNYEEDKHDIRLVETIKVYYYRSDLIRSVRKESILDFRDYDNNGDWYVFLDEAHRGETGVSNIQDYISILSRNGFLFNFSATFTDEIDYSTTVFNFNLEKFINAGYGKNIYLSNSNFDFKSKINDFTNREKQKQVLKSLIVFSYIKKSKPENYYHAPLLVTLVNSINTDDSDMLLFFKKLEEIATGKLDSDILEESKAELVSDFGNLNYVYGDEKLLINSEDILSLGFEDILLLSFNSRTTGQIEIIEGKKGKEMALKLETSDTPFCLIKIGDTDKFRKEKLGSNYYFNTSYTASKDYFEDINKDSRFNMLLGSRSFYEGWDSNRPNVLNFINIGGNNARKYVLQSIGRGIRIEPEKNLRKRLPINNENKSSLLETLFLFTTDKRGVEAILRTIDENKDSDEVKIELRKTDNASFRLLVPKYKSSESDYTYSLFNVSQENIERFEDYLHSIDKSLFVTKYDLTPMFYDLMLERLLEGKLFQKNKSNHYSDYSKLLEDLISYMSQREQILNGITDIQNEIIHFKEIKVLNLSKEEIGLLKNKIENVSNYVSDREKEILIEQFKNNDIDDRHFTKVLTAKQEEKFKDLVILNIASHYYTPVIYSTVSKVEYIRNIITVESEVTFIQNLSEYVNDNVIDSKWMFSKLNENTDEIYIPYFSKVDNKYRKFFPDFIFWSFKDNDYKITFVDPKGTTNTDYINKIEGFQKLFYNDDIPIIFEHDGMKVSFDLKLITDDKNKVPERYYSFWLNNEDFLYLKIKKE